jgi:DNA polymerase III epsilon subunit-like protein
MEEYTAWVNVPANLKTKTQLGREGLKPARGQQVAARFCSYIRGKSRPTYYDLYDVGEAQTKRAATPAQLSALAAAQDRSRWLRTCAGGCGHTITWKKYHRLMPDHITAEGRYYCRHCMDHEAATRWAREVLADPAAIILDTETTSLEGQPIEIAIINIAGETLLDTLVQATEPVTPRARSIHRITDEELSTAPTFPEVYPQLCHILEAASSIIIYNADFDYDTLERARRVHQLPHYPVAEFRADDQGDEDKESYWWRGLTCAMKEYARWYGEWSSYYRSYRWQPLEGGHRALGDCIACLDLIKKMANEKKEEA